MYPLTSLIQIPIDAKEVQREQTTESTQARGLSLNSISCCHYWTADEPRRALCTGLYCLLMANANIS